MPTPEIDATRMNRRAALGLTGAVGFLAATRALGATPEEEPERAMVAFVLRHAEAAGGTSDPSLSPLGRDRAARLGLMLRSVGAQRVLHTATARSRETAVEIGRVLRVGVGSYDMHDPGPVTGRMLERGGVWVIVGHSNTVPDLVRRLGGDTGLDLLPEATYDQLFMVLRAGGGGMTVPLHA